MPWLDHPMVWALLVCLALQFVAWSLQKKWQNADTVDIAWSAGVVLSGVVYVLLINSQVNNLILICLFPIAWYTRLTHHLLQRFDHSHEDRRYQNLRRHWQHHTQLKFSMFFGFQALLSVVFSLPAYWVLSTPSISTVNLVIAGLWGLLALVGVTVADHQLLKFKRTHDSTAVCDVGLWRYSRHPNYFFEWLHWWVYPMVLWHSDYFWWSLLVTALMLVFLLKLTGIPFAEAQALKKRGQAYRDYMNKTSVFILWRPRND